MKQIVFIHGADSFRTYDEYFAALKTWTYEPPTGNEKKWKDSLVPALGEDWEMLSPAMPAKHNARYDEWSVWFEKVIPYMRDDVILVGHSMGAIFLAKYLNERTMPVHVAGAFLVAPPYDDESEEYLDGFKISKPLTRLAQHVKNIFIYHSEDDSVVPFTELAKYQRALPAATIRTFTDRDHFFAQPEFPELVKDIRSIAMK